MKFVLILSLFMLSSTLLSVGLHSQSKTSVRMTMYGHYNGEKEITEREDNKMDGCDYCYQVDYTCFDTKYLIISGKHKNVKITIHCGVDGQIVYSQKKTDLNGKFKIPMTKVKDKLCDWEQNPFFSVVVTDLENDWEIYRGEVSGDLCEG